MKKILITMMVVFLAAVMIYGFSAKANAGVAGQPCYNCHTMHASQGGTTSPPNNYLAKASCIGCHTGSGPASNAYVDRATGILAGGTFKESVATAKEKRHDVVGLSTTSSDIAAPGNTGSPQTVNAAELTCAGSKGCHGTHDVVGDAGISGYHHGSKVGYRFLQIGAAAYNSANQVLGTGSADYEYNAGTGPTATNHNVYSASTTFGISKLCGNCHGVFHGTAADHTGSASPFIRHPTDNLISTISTPTVNYSANPFAFAVVTGLSTSVAYVVADARVSCLSCHRAHGTAEDDILRFAYSAQLAGSSTVTSGCLGCHTKQRGS